MLGSGVHIFPVEFAPRILCYLSPWVNIATVVFGFRVAGLCDLLEAFVFPLTENHAIFPNVGV